MDFSTLVTGNIVAITLNTSNRLIGEFSGYNDEPKTIVLKNVRFQYDLSQFFDKSCFKSDIIFGDLSVECKHILKLDVLKEDTPGSSVVQAVEKPASLHCKKSTFNWMPGKNSIRLHYQADIQKELQQSMQDYCKKIFGNTNFTQLISQPGEKVDIGLPKYFVKFHREPAMPVTCDVELNNGNRKEQATALQEKLKSENVVEMDNKAEENGNSAEIASEKPVEEDENYGYPFITVHQLNFDDDDEDDEELNQEERVQNKSHAQKLSDFPHFQLSPFLRYSNGELYLNEDYFNLVCEPAEHVATGEREPLLIEDITNLVINCQSMRE